MTSPAPTEQLKEEGVWKALADPVRRRLMDLVRESPKTTGELAAGFDSLGRCAIMKHLAVLEESGLIVPKKEGKFRWNYINAIPLREIYERWVKKYEAQWASNLLQLRELAEYKSNSDRITNNLFMERQANNISILLEIPIQADIGTVWECLINETGIWWRKDFYTSKKTKNFIIEPRVGGRMYEDFGNDEGLLWANVIVLDSPYVLELKGHLSPQFGGPAVSFLKLSLKETGETTILTLSDNLFGYVSDNTKKELSAGWKLLYEDGFKSYVEKKAG